MAEDPKAIAVGEKCPETFTMAEDPKAIAVGEKCIDM